MKVLYFYRFETPRTFKISLIFVLVSRIVFYYLLISQINLKMSAEEEYLDGVLYVEYNLQEEMSLFQGMNNPLGWYTLSIDVLKWF